MSHFKKFLSPRPFLFLGVFLLAALLRFGMPPFFPHFPNFSPFTAMALFLGVYFERRLLAVFSILATVWLSDIAINYLYFHQLIFFYEGFYWQYSAYFLITLIGMLLPYQKKASFILASTLFSTCLFFLISNFGTWIGFSLYPKNLTGLMSCYIAALPFLKYSALGDLFFSAAFFSLFEAHLVPSQFSLNPKRG